MNYSVKVDTSQLTKGNLYTDKSLGDYIQTCLKQSCLLIRKYARNNHDFETRTGRLERAIKFMVLKRSREGIVYIDPAVANYGVYVHEPTGLYGPRNSKYPIVGIKGRLKFFWERLGTWVSFKSVSHPGSPADRFIYQALEKNKEKIDDIFRDNLPKLFIGGKK